MSAPEPREAIFADFRGHVSAAVLAALEADGHDIHSPCCTTCKGTGATYDPETSGRCWDCRGTGHAHEREPWREEVDRGEQ